MKFPFFKAVFWNLLLAPFLPIFLIAALLPGRRRLLVWGSQPLISNKYWSEAMKRRGHASMTIMEGFFRINKREDFDRYFDDFAPSFLPGTVRTGLGCCIAFLFVLRNAKVMHVSFFGFALDRSLFWRLEIPLFRLAGIKVVAMPFGADFYMYSKLLDPAFRHSVLSVYPGLALLEPRIEQRVRYWSTKADIVISGPMIDGLGRWDVTMAQFFVIDTDAWSAPAERSDADGHNGAVRVMHTPNHRGAKGTEFLLEAVRQLQEEGLTVELELLERVPNEEVRCRMQNVDILAEQFTFTGYALSGIEGMASGLPVMANLEHEGYTRVLRRYSFLNECPILSASPESLKNNLRLLVERPELRRVLGRAGRAYAERYHSYAAAQFLFEAVYDKLFNGSDVHLLNLYHPLMSDYVRTNPVQHPLIENRLPAEASQAPC